MAEWVNDMFFLQEKANTTQSAVNRNATYKSREIILLLFLAFVRPLDTALQERCEQIEKNLAESSKIYCGLENMT